MILRGFVSSAACSNTRKKSQQSRNEKFHERDEKKRIRESASCYVACLIL